MRGVGVVGSVGRCAVRRWVVASAHPPSLPPAPRPQDANGDGKVSWQEFLTATAERQMINFQNQMWTAFQTYDLDGDGRITVDELRAAMKGETTERLLGYIREFDADGDGSIDYAEFLKMLCGPNINIVAA